MGNRMIPMRIFPLKKLIKLFRKQSNFQVKSVNAIVGNICISKNRPNRLNSVKKRKLSCKKYLSEKNKKNLIEFRFINYFRTTQSFTRKKLSKKGKRSFKKMNQSKREVEVEEIRKQKRRTKVKKKKKNLGKEFLIEWKQVSQVSENKQKS